MACGAPDVGSGQPCGGKFGAACLCGDPLGSRTGTLCGTGCGGIFMRPSTLRSLLPLAGAPRSRRFLFFRDDATLAGSPLSRLWQFPLNSVLPSRPAVMAVWQSNFAIFVEKGATSAGVAIFKRVTRTTPNEFAYSGGLIRWNSCSSRICLAGRCRTWFQPLGLTRWGDLGEFICCRQHSAIVRQCNYWVSDFS